jgi:hypothetical protein
VVSSIVRRFAKQKSGVLEGLSATEVLVRVDCCPCFSQEIECCFILIE